MTVQIGNIVLDDNLRLYGLDTARDIAVDQVSVMDGSSVLQTMPMSGGRAISLVATLEGDSVYGIYTRAQVMAIKALAATGIPQIFTHHLGSFTVLIVSTDDMEAVMDYADPTDADWYIGSIQMIEV